LCKPKRFNTVIYSVSKTTCIGNQYKNLATCFSSLNHPEANFSKHSTGTFSKCAHCGIPYCLQIILPLTFKNRASYIRGLLEKYPTFGREKETGLLGALDT
jgi:hypothetical protein